jgi:hypothetical protein
VLQGFSCDVVGPVSREVLRKAERGDVEGALLGVNLRGEQIFAVLPELIALEPKIMMTSGHDDARLVAPEFRDLPRLAKPFDERAMCDAGSGEPARPKLPTLDLDPCCGWKQARRRQWIPFLSGQRSPFGPSAVADTVEPRT